MRYAGSNSLARRLRRAFATYKYRYAMIIPGIVFFALFCYMPMIGNVIAFQRYSYAKGMFGSEWIGLENFRRALSDHLFIQAFQNQLTISFTKLLVVFPMPIILALALNAVAQRRLKRLYQTVLTFPHFISWVIVYGILYSLLADGGVVNQLLVAVGLQKQSILTNRHLFRPLLYVSDIWKESGWDSIIYLAALTSINPELYEASAIDGAGGWKQLLHITWPGIRSLVSLMLILTIGSMLSGGFQQILNLYNPMVYSVADTIDTYVFRTGIQGGGNFGYTAAIGLFKGVINLILLFTANFIVKRFDGEGVF